jgi:putative ABC transport system permease protein
MTLPPIIAALRKHKAGVVLIAMQIALTLAIVCNAIFIIYTRVDNVRRPTGMDESNLFLVQQQWVGAPSTDDAAGLQKQDALVREDLDALRAMPGVESVTPTNSMPLLNSSWGGSVALKPGTDLRGGDARSIFYYGDDQFLRTLGLRLVAGRNFTSTEVVNRSFRDNSEPDVVIVTKALADKLFPQGDAIGKVMYINGDTKPSTIVGEVQRLQVSTTSSWVNNFPYNSVIGPIRLDSNFARYIVRTKPGQMDAAMRAVPDVLYKVNPMRVIDDDGVRSFADIRAQAYRADIGMAVLMGVVCIILLAVTAAGIVGLTSFWVGQRHRQIGVRRALGARKIDILHYFQLENLLIAGVGALVGIALAIGLNMVLIQSFEMDRMPLVYVLCGLAVVMVLGQAAVFVPARRASNVPPVVATRSV